MRILLLTHAFNALAQRLFVELREGGHEVSVELDIADAVTEEALALWRPELLIAPYLKRRLPSAVWGALPCLVVHPGPPGDRGPSALDHAVLDGQRDWGVTVLQAGGEIDAGPVWAWRPVTLRQGATKSSLYRHEVTQAAVEAVHEAVARVVSGQGPAIPSPPVRPWRPLVTREDRRIDWARDDMAQVLRLVRSGDGAPGALAILDGREWRLFDLHEGDAGDAGGVHGRAADARAADARAADMCAAKARPAGGPDGAAGAADVTVTGTNDEGDSSLVPPGQLLARRGPAVLVATRDGAVWVGHLRPAEGELAALKLPAVDALGAIVTKLPEWTAPLEHPRAQWDELRLERHGSGAARWAWLEFDFHNGALGERQCARLVQALREALAEPLALLVLAGGTDFFCNGIHLHEIEAAAHREGDSAPDASWRNIQAIDDVVLEILRCTGCWVVAALRGNAGAGGAFVALAADEVWAHEGVVLNPHYKNMGNLYGSEYWTYTLPRRVGAARAESIMQRRLPTGARQALREGLVDACLGADAVQFEALALKRAGALARDPGLASRIAEKARRRAADEALRPLADHRAAELARMQRNFYGFDPSYHVARHHFVHRKPHAWTPRHLALHR